IGRQTAEELSERFEAAGRRPDADNRKRGHASRRVCLVARHRGRGHHRQRVSGRRCGTPRFPLPPHGPPSLLSPATVPVSEVLAGELPTVRAALCTRSGTRMTNNRSTLDRPLGWYLGQFPPRYVPGATVVRGMCSDVARPARG